VREAEALHTRAPRWLVDLVPIKPSLGVAQVSSGWAALGRLEVESQAGFAYDELWAVAIQTALGLATIGALAMLVGWLGVRRIRARLDEVVSQAQALHERQYREVALPKTPELRRVAMAMNALVGRVRSQSEQHADEVEHLRRSAHDDRLTGVSMRSHFLIRVGLALQGDVEQEDGVQRAERGEPPVDEAAGRERHTAVAAGGPALLPHRLTVLLQQGDPGRLGQPAAGRQAQEALCVGIGVAAATCPLNQQQTERGLLKLGRQAGPTGPAGLGARRPPEPARHPEGRHQRQQ